MDVSEPLAMIQLSSDHTFHFELLRALSNTRSGGADVTETLQVAARIKPGDFESWYSEWVALAERVHQQALSARSRISKRDAFFRASTYYRVADFYLHGNWDDPRINELWKKQAECFDRATELLTIPPYRDTIQADGFEIPVIVFPASKDRSVKRPTVLLGNGFDGSMEEAYHGVGTGALERGYNVVLHEGPGQPTVRRSQNLGFRYDWEKVVTPVVDYALTLPFVDPAKIGLVGNSMGGYLAARAVAFEKRIAAVFLIDGVYSMGDAMSAGSQFEEAADTEKMMAALKSGHLPTKLRWAITHGMWSFVTKDPAKMKDEFEKMTIQGIEDKITCPVFLADAADDLFFKGQPEKVRDALGDNVTYYEFTAADGAGAHCHVGATTFLNQVIYDWYEGVVGEAPPLD